MTKPDDDRDVFTRARCPQPQDFSAVGSATFVSLPSYDFGFLAPAMVIEVLSIPKLKRLLDCGSHLDFRCSLNCRPG